LSSADDDFRQRLSNSLEQALGVKIVSVLYSILKSDFGIEKDEVPEKSGRFENSSEKNLGSTGLDFLEMLISKEILTEFGLVDNLEANDYLLAEALRKARQKVYPG
jgi:hypothetical protein